MTTVCRRRASASVFGISTEAGGLAAELRDLFVLRRTAGAASARRW